MDILGIGFPELLFIFIIALMVFGPRRLPEIAGKAGRLVRDLRNMSQGFLAEWQREITVAARIEELEEVRKELEETKQSLRQTKKELNSDAQQIGQTINTVARTNPTTLSSEAKPTNPGPNSDSPAVSPEAAPAATLPAEMAENTAQPAPSQDKPAAETPDSALSMTEMSQETPEVEKNGTASKPVPAPVSPTEVAE
jgi:Tat protein translocase TatB subunit